MKTLHIIATCFALSFMSLNNADLENDQYLEMMQKCITELYNASEIGQLQRTVNTLERIALAEAEKWEPQYYIAFGNIMMATHAAEGSRKDVYLDQAKVAIEKAKAIMPDESEIISLEGFVHMLRITVDPGSRGPELAPLAMQTFERAIRLNPENPRALVLSAQMQFGSAKFLGNSTDEACSLTKTSLSKFDTIQYENPLAPSWGRVMAESLLQQCK